MSEQHGTAGAEPVTFINVFEIPADQAPGFIEGWAERARIMSTKRGFRDSMLHRALSPEGRFQLINVAHWDSAEAYADAHTDPEFQARIDTVRQYRQVAANPQLYRVVAGYALPPGTREPVPVGQAFPPAAP